MPSRVGLPQRNARSIRSRPVFAGMTQYLLDFGLVNPVPLDVRVPSAWVNVVSNLHALLYHILPTNINCLPNVQTTTIYTHVAEKNVLGVRSPLDG